MIIKLEQIQKKLAEAIKLSDLTQSQIANQLNLNPATISHYIKGDKLPALDTFASLCFFTRLRRQRYSLYYKTMINFL